MKKRIRTTAWITTVCLMAGLCLPVHAENQPALPETAVEIVAQQQVAGNYRTYLENHGDATYPIGRWEFGSDYITKASDKVVTNGSAEALNKEEATEKRSPVSLFTDNGVYAEWTVSVEEAGLYRLAVVYCGLDGKQLDIETELTINGAVPFGTTARFLLPRSYKDEGSIYQDGLGNDVRPMKVEVMEWIERSLTDKDGVYSEPYAFYFEKGTNTIRLDMVQADVAIDKIVLYNEKELPTYKQYNQQNRADKTKVNKVKKDALHTVEGENAYRVTHTVLNPSYDRQSALTSPQDPAKLKLNTIGSGNWKMPGQTITWQITVDQPGYYQLGMRARQNLVRGFFSSRNIYIDGELLFKEMQEVEVEYSSGWKIIMIGKENDPYEIYLTAGTHTITMEAVGGVVGTSVQEFEEIIFELNEMYRDMIMVTGTTPDTYRDYKLEQEIPDLHKRMKNLIKRLRAAKKKIESYTSEGGSNVATAEQIAQQLESFIEKPRSVPSRLANFQSNISSLSGYVLSLKEQPLEVDYLFFKSPKAALPKAEAGFFTQIIFRWNAFISSFFEDYSQLSDEDYGDDALEVWVGLGRDQTQIIKDLTENFFTPQTKVPVNLSLVQQGLIEAIAAGKGPDVMLYTDSATPVNLAARNQLVDLSKMDGFDTVKSWYTEGIMTPFTYNGGVYAIPLQQSVSMLFCRTDILEEIGVEVPKTWDEFYLVTTQIQKKKLEVGVPVGTAILPNNSMFDTLLLQNNATYYNEDHSATAFDTEEAMKAFKQWTEFYTKYSLDVEFDFLNRFRSGQMPMAIQDYMMYNTLAVAAPEIRGLWTMTAMPGTIQADGTINGTAASTVMCAIMLEKAGDKKENAFRFMQWFASADVQTEYGLAVENVLGEGGRYNPSNLEALENMNWSNEELQKIRQQVTTSEFIPNIPATYYITRNITNAFRAVVNKGLIPREALNSYNLDMNSEITRKRIELGLE